MSQNLDLTAIAKFVTDMQAKAVGEPDTEVVREGKRMVLPEDMSYPVAIKTLERKMKEETTPVTIAEEVNAYPLDGAYQMTMVLREMFGWAQAVPTKIKTMFGTKEIAPEIMTLEVGYQEYAQVIWGSFAVPGVEGTLETGHAVKDGRPIFVIQGTVTKGTQATVKEIADKVRERVRKFSVYRAKAIRLKTDDSGNLNMRQPPGFIDLSRVNPEELTFSDSVRAQIETSLFTPIKRTALCRQHKIPLKRGILLEGPYGTGKTLTAYVTAKMCPENGWTFIYLDRVQGLKSAMMFAQQYGPAVIFAEDIDRAMAGERSVKIDDILNQIDGIESKSQELIVILTTNHVEKIEKAMLRPGRLDAIVRVNPPDARAAERLIRLYGRSLIEPSADLTGAGKELDGQIPATIREVVERSKLFAISHLQEGKELRLTADDLVHAAREMKHHLTLMAPPAADNLTPEAKLGLSMAEVFKGSVNGGLTHVAARVAAAEERIVKEVQNH